MFRQTLRPIMLGLLLPVMTFLSSIACAQDNQDEPLLDKLARTETAEEEARIDFDSLPVEQREAIAEQANELASKFFVSRPIKRLRGERFTILTDLANNEYIHRISGNLESTFEVLDTLFEGNPPEDAASIPVYVYRESVSFDTLAVTLDSPDATGIYLPGIPLLAFGMDAPSGQSMAGIMIHEATHAYVDRNVRPSGVYFPLWFEEGIAEYVGNSEIRKGKLLLGTLRRKQRLRLGDIVSTNVKSRAYLQLDSLRKSLRKTGGPTLSEVLSADRSTIYGEDKHVYYAASWAFVHFLRHNREDSFRGRFQKLVEELCDGKESLEAVRSVYGDLTALEKAYRRYVRRLGP